MMPQGNGKRGARPRLPRAPREKGGSNLEATGKPTASERLKHQTTPRNETTEHLARLKLPHRQHEESPQTGGAVVRDEDRRLLSPTLKPPELYTPI